MTAHVRRTTATCAVDECGRFTRWMTPDEAADSLRQAGKAAPEMVEEEEEEGAGSS